MKNEVKKKMHAEWRAMVYQSHCETTRKKKIINVVPSKPVMNMRSREIKTQPRSFFNRISRPRAKGLTTT
jgi:hypothetical protein